MTKFNNVKKNDVWRIEQKLKSYEKLLINERIFMFGGNLLFLFSIKSMLTLCIKKVKLSVR